MSLTEAQLNFPRSVFVSSNNEVYIADSNNHRIRKIIRNGNIVTIAGNGRAGNSGDGGLATNAQVNNAAAVFVSSNNEVYIADSQNHRIRKILQNGNIITIAGNSSGFSGDNGPATQARLSNPISVFVSSNNEVYIADSHNNRIRKILQDGNIITIAGNGTVGYSGDNGPAIKAQLTCPTAVFVSNNEVYIADSQNHRIRKVLQNGNIITIAGNGTAGYSGDNGPATQALLYYPKQFYVSSNNEVYIADPNNHRIRKVLQNGNIITIAGNGIRGFSGDNGPATQAQLNSPFGIFVSPNNEVYIADSDNHRIRKILQNGNIITIAGYGTKGYSGDSPFDISLYPHINSPLPLCGLKKASRDQLFRLEIYGFMPLIERMSPQFSQILKNEKLISSMSPTQHAIIQKMIDSLIYDKQLIFSINELLDALVIFGLFKNAEFIYFKRCLISEFVNNNNLTEFPSNWETVESLLTTCKEFGIQNNLLECLHNYCIEYAAVNMKTPEGNAVLPTLPIVMRNGVAVFSKLLLTQPSPIIIDEEIEIKPETLESLFNDKKTSDIQIRMGTDKYLYCHKTVLSSSSTLFAALFKSGSSFSDLNNGIFTPDESEDLELLEIIIKHCYGIPLDKIDTLKIIGLLDMSMKHEIEYLVNYCKNNFNLSIQNYFSIVSTCEHYFEFPIFEGFFKEIIRFGIENKKQLFTDLSCIAKLPERVCQLLLLKLAQEN